MLLSLAPPRLQKNADVVLEAVRHDGRAVYHADLSLKEDPGFMLAAMQQCDLGMNMGSAHVLTYAPAGFRGFRSADFLMAASRQDVEALNYAHSALGLTGATPKRKLAQLELLIA